MYRYICRLDSLKVKCLGRKVSAFNFDCFAKMASEEVVPFATLLAMHELCCLPTAFVEQCAVRLGNIANLESEK